MLVEEIRTFQCLITEFVSNPQSLRAHLENGAVHQLYTTQHPSTTAAFVEPIGDGISFADIRKRDVHLPSRLNPSPLPPPSCRRDITLSVDGDRLNGRGGACVLVNHYRHSDSNDYKGQDDEGLSLHDGLREPAPIASSDVSNVLQTS